MCIFAALNRKSYIYETIPIPSYDTLSLLRIHTT